MAVTERTRPDQLRSPQQARSIDSTNRMLDAVEAILARGEGVAGVTVAAVGRESGVSVGALYHRFGDREGLVTAAQDRLLTRLEQTWLDPSIPLWNPPADADLLAGPLRDVVDTTLQVFLTDRVILRAFLATKESLPQLAARGTAAFDRMAGFMVARLAAWHQVPTDRARMAFALLFGQVLMIMMFDDTELAGVQVGLERRQAEVHRAMAAVLTGSESG